METGTQLYIEVNNMYLSALWNSVSMGQGLILHGSGG